MKVTPLNKSFFKHKVGQHFELPDKAARTLIKAGLLAEVAETTEPKKRHYRRRDMVAQA